MNYRPQTSCKFWETICDVFYLLSSEQNVPFYELRKLIYPLN